MRCVEFPPSKLCQSQSVDTEDEDVEREWLEDGREFIRQCGQLVRCRPQRIYVLLDLNTCFTAYALLPSTCHCFAFGSSALVSRVLSHRSTPPPRRFRLVAGVKQSSTYMSTLCGALIKQWRSKGVLVILVTDDTMLRKDLLRQFSCWKIFGAGFGSNELDCMRAFVNGICSRE
jgi:hypothetical protein